MLKQFSFISMRLSHVVTEHESKTFCLSTALIFIVLSWNILGLYSLNKHSRAGGWDHSPPPAHQWRGPRMGSLGSQKFLRKGDLRRSVRPGHRVGDAGGRNGQENVLGSHRASLSCGNSGAAEGTAAFPSPCSPSCSSTEVQASCLTPVVLSLLFSIILMFPNLRSITAKGKVAGGERPARAEYPQRTVGTKSEQRVLTLGQAEKTQHRLHLKLKEK